MKILYYDCFAGISGDMNLGALIDLGVDENDLITQLSRLNLEGYKLEISRKIKKGIEGTKVDVLLEEPSNHHEDDNQRTPHHHHHSNPHRNLKDIKDIINNSNLSDRIKSQSINIFKKVAVAEAKIHGKSVDEVHFHEVGAVDSIIDIVGAAICLDILKPDRIVSTSIQLGGGFAKCAHGTFPVPAPATAEILKNIPVKTGLVPFETTTPTGAAILATVVDEFSDKHHFQSIKTGYGLGTRDFDHIPNVLRVFLAEEVADVSSDENIIIECNIDDMNPENYNFIIQRLFEHGADDVFITPIYMKKNRPAVKLSVLGKNSKKNQLADILFHETTTFGLRYTTVQKMALERRFSEIKVQENTIRIKQAFYNNQFLKYKPEYEDCYQLANKLNIPIREAYRLVEKEIEKQKHLG